LSNNHHCLVVHFVGPLWFHIVSTYGGERSYCILNKNFIENSCKSKLNIIKEFGHALGILGKPSKSIGFNEDDL
jgi:hypothetical protein